MKRRLSPQLDTARLFTWKITVHCKTIELEIAVKLDLLLSINTSGGVIHSSEGHFQPDVLE